MRGGLTVLLAAIALAAGPAVAEALPPLRAAPDPEAGGRILDDRGREVILRGVNVNSLGEYWQGTDVKPTLPLERDDPARMASIGWNVVRLIVSWSRVEPQPGQYNERYLDRVEKWIGRFERAGMYTIVDFHQDAWGATLAARPGEACPTGYEPAFGWDGAPGWATLDEGEPRCFLNNREINPAVMAAWTNFFDDAVGPGGVGIQTRYTRMLAHVAERFASDGSVLGIDVMNEPNAFGAQTAQLGSFYERSVTAIRRGERRGAGFRHPVLIEPSVLWSLVGQGPPPPFDHDRQIIYSPHLYGGSIGGEGPPSEASFETARAEAAANFGGAPVLTGEWGGDPDRATGAPDDYFNAHQALQDEHLIGATLWTWKQSCGDPHAASHGGPPPLPPWSLFEMDCSDGGNEIVGMDPELRRDLARGYVRRSPGAIDSMRWDVGDGRLTASGRGGGRGEARIEAWVPSPQGGVRISGHNLGDVTVSRPAGNGYRLLAETTGRRWTLRVSSR